MQPLLGATGLRAGGRGAAGRRQLRPGRAGEARAKQSIDVSDKMKTVGSGYIPKNHQTTCSANSKGLFAYYQVAETSFILTCRTADGTGSGWAGTTGIKDPSPDRRRRS